jgi:hypothetical protein
MRSEWTAQRDREYGDGKKNDERWRTRCRERRWLGSDDEAVIVLQAARKSVEGF